MKETIKCPECGTIQEAEVKESIPWNVKIHECDKCKYLIMESEYELHGSKRDTNTL